MGEKIKQTTYLKSPVNYPGGKYKLLPQLVPLFPKEIHTFIDMCCGACNVGANVKAQYWWFCDVNIPLIYMWDILQHTPIEDIETHIEKRIKEFELDDDEHVEKGYYEFRKFYNSITEEEYLKDDKQEHGLDLYILHCYAYNNQIRFNKKGEFNSPYGARKWNPVQKRNLEKFLKRIDNFKVGFITCEFDQFPYDLYPEDFIYIDPPYSIGRAVYNENGGWSDRDDYRLFEQLDKWTEQGFRWGMSNVIKHKDVYNTRLVNWLKENEDRYFVYDISSDYKNCSYNLKYTRGKTQEIFVVNYQPEIEEG